MIRKAKEVLKAWVVLDQWDMICGSFQDYPRAYEYCEALIKLDSRPYRIVNSSELEDR